MRHSGIPNNAQSKNDEIARIVDADALVSRPDMTLADKVRWLVARCVHGAVAASKRWHTILASIAERCTGISRGAEKRSPHSWTMRVPSLPKAISKATLAAPPMLPICSGSRGSAHSRAGTNAFGFTLTERRNGNATFGIRIAPSNRRAVAPHCGRARRQGRRSGRCRAWRTGSRY